MNQLCRVCGEPAAGFHFGAFTCEGCKSFFGRTCNNVSTLGDCKNGDQCIITRKNRTTCKSCRLRKCLSIGMSKSGSRYGRRSNWFKIHCLMQDGSNQPQEESNKDVNLKNEEQMRNMEESNNIGALRQESIFQTVTSKAEPEECPSEPTLSEEDSNNQQNTHSSPVHWYNSDVFPIITALSPFIFSPVVPQPTFPDLSRYYSLLSLITRSMKSEEGSESPTAPVSRSSSNESNPNDDREGANTTDVGQTLGKVTGEGVSGDEAILNFVSKINKNNRIMDSIKSENISFGVHLSPHKSVCGNRKRLSECSFQPNKVQRRETHVDIAEDQLEPIDLSFKNSINLDSNSPNLSPVLSCSMTVTAFNTEFRQQQTIAQAVSKSTTSNWKTEETNVATAVDLTCSG